MKKILESVKRIAEVVIAVVGSLIAMNIFN